VKSTKGEEYLYIYLFLLVISIIAYSIIGILRIALIDNYWLVSAFSIASIIVILMLIILLVLAVIGLIAKGR
jgi:hypothetical protein